MPMSRLSVFRIFSTGRLLPLLLLAGLASCGRTPQPGRGEAPVLLRMDTKALGSGEHTFRVAIFDENFEYTGRSGSYCSLPDSHPWWTFPWIPPCKVDDVGNPLDGTDAVVDHLEDADHDGQFGLRWDGATSPSGNVSLVAVSPALKVEGDGTPAVYAYVRWQHDVPLYVSEPASGTFSGSWMDGEYVYSSDTKLSGTMVDQRASVKIKIQCDRLDEGDIQYVALTNTIRSARFYLREKTPISRGVYTVDDYTLGTQGLYDCGAGDPMHLTKTPETTWTSSPVFLPALDFSDISLDALRPVVVVRLGTDKVLPFTAYVRLNQKLEEMKEYTYTLLVSKTYVHVLLDVSSWDDGGSIDTEDEYTADLGTVSVAGGWESGGGGDTDPWHDED